MNAIQIKHRFTGVVLFEGESGMTMRQALEQATTAKADLRFANLGSANLGYADLGSANLGSADLGYANLGYANLRSANLRFANLRFANLGSADLGSADLGYADLGYADLRSANLDSADLGYANLRSANLRFANLRSADLGYADLGGKKLVGNRPFFSIGPIGSRGDYIQTWITDYGLMISAGCFFGTKAEFESKLTDEHGDNVHGNEYRAALVIIDKHAELWTPVTTEKLGQSA